MDPNRRILATYPKKNKCLSYILIQKLKYIKTFLEQYYYIARDLK